MGLIFLDRLLFVHAPFVSEVRFQFLAQLPVDHLTYLVIFIFFFHELFPPALADGFSLESEWKPVPLIF